MIEDVKILYKHDYRGLFENLVNVLGRTPTLYDYHGLYSSLIGSISFWNLSMPFRSMLNGNNTFDETDIQIKFEIEKDQLDAIFNEYVAKHEKPENMNIEEFMKNQNKLNIKIANFFDSFVKEKSGNFYDSISEKLRLKIGGVVSEFEEFYNDLPLLVKRKFMSKTEDKIICENKSFLHDYFKSITPHGKNTKWEPVHKLFGVTNLNSAKSIDKDSKLFEQWKAIKQDIPTCI